MKENLSKLKTRIQTGRISRMQLIFTGAGFLLYGAAALLNQGDSAEALQRNLPGGGTAVYQVSVRGLTEETGESLQLEIPVRERVYTEEEAEQAFAAVKQMLETRILGENTSADQVWTDLELPSYDWDHAVEISWESERSELIDRWGQVSADLAPEKGEKVKLTAWLKTGDRQENWSIDITVVPVPASSQEKEAAAFLEQIAKMDLEQEHEEYLSLPRSYDGRHLDYEPEEDPAYKILPALGIALALLWPFWEQTEVKKEQEKRDRLLLLDYSEIVSKLMIFIGAGMTIPRAWERIVTDYEAGAAAGKADGEKRRRPWEADGRKQRKQKERPAYEEMCRAYYRMQSGLAEGQAYREFGRRCGLQPYIKLSTMLEQNRREGNRQLRTLLSAEMADAFEQRKNLARKMGEEAGTKLLIPLFLMLGIVMVMIMTPAFLSFY